MRDWADVAILAKAKGNDGRFVVRCTAGLPLLLEEGDEVAFVPPRTDLPRRATVSFVRETGAFEGEVEFDGIVGAQVPRDMLGMHCLIRRDSIDPEVFQTEPRMWAGWIVEDERFGLLGEVYDVLDNPGQALLQVKRADENGMLLVPAVDDIVIDVDIEGERLFTAIPQGLLELES